MTVKCEHCGKQFNTNAGLYDHVERFHNKPSVILVNHNRHKKHWTKKGPPTPMNTGRKRPRSDGQDDDGLHVIDEYDHRKTKKKMAEERDDELDDDMEVIDEYSNDTDPEDDDDLIIKDEYVAPIDKEEEIRPPPRPDVPPSNLDYKKMFEQCMKRYKDSIKKQDGDIRSLKIRFNRKLVDLEQLKDVECNDRLQKLLKEGQSQIDKLNADHTSKLAVMERDCGERIQKLTKEGEFLINKLNTDHEAKIKEMEKDCQRTINTLQGTINDMKSDDDDLRTLSKAIFNCTTIEEISEIQRLIQNHQLDAVVQNHLETLQNLFLSLSYGVIPICDSQRRVITNSQRDLVEKIQSASRTTAKKQLMEGRVEIINLFSIINDSLKLIRKSFNRYGIREQSE